jgi:hypothetical protein
MEILLENKIVSLKIASSCPLSPDGLKVQVYQFFCWFSSPYLCCHKKGPTFMQNLSNFAIAEEH